MRHPTPGSPEERARFAQLKAQLPEIFRRVTVDPNTPQTVVVVPSLSLHPDELAKISGVHHYEERLLYMLMLLRLPRTNLVFVTSNPIHPSIVDYYLHLLTGVPGSHARRRLTLLACHDASPKPLSQKILERPRLQQRIREAIVDPETSHLSVFNSTHLERSLAVALNLPLHAPDPALNDLGTKSGCREVFREAGVLLPDGFERLRDEGDIVDAIDALIDRNPGLRRVVVKLNDGFSGEGNALFYTEGAPESGRKAWIRERLPGLRFEAPQETYASYIKKYEEMGGVVECFVEGKVKTSPSCQARVNALGEAMTISTHDQVLGGPSGQVFLGCTFPAVPDYRLEIQEAGYEIAKALAARGVVGRFATDFVSVKEGDEWQHYAIEVNLRKGGTTHPFLTLKFLTDGTYDHTTGQFLTPNEKPKYYYASDTLHADAYRGHTPDDLIDIAVFHGLHFHGASERGVVFHLMGALSEFGKLGVLCIGDNPQQARFLYNKTVGVLDQETSAVRDR
ncbi:MAG: carboxylate-amine ligase [Alphaproteobacteria bacterium]|nr:carboxylate-amine ligase [Alphaproteobacteria bacterium]MCB9795798.1 carboxylate-amine ligase [Alphaproteobacteria bacterium]